MARKIREQEIYWEGRHWTVRLIPAGTVRTEDVSESEAGTIRGNENLIAVRHDNDDIAILTLFHEMLHRMIKSNVVELSTKEEEALIERGEIMFKTFLEAFGVDLSPLLKGYK